MKTVLFLILSVLMVSAADVPGSRTMPAPTATIQAADCECVQVRRIRGDNCGAANSLRIEYRNVCGGAVNAQIYARWNRESERQRVGPPANLRPGASASFFWCQEPYEVAVACE